VRIVANRSPAADGQSSADSVGRRPAARPRPVSGQPKPIFASTSGLIDTELPAPASIRRDFHANRLADLPSVAAVTSYVTIKTLSADPT
jgi:hypothetical protein